MSKNLFISLVITAVFIIAAFFSQQNLELQDEFTMWEYKFQKNWSQS